MPGSERSVTALEIKEIFQNKQDRLSEDGKVLLSHFGAFTQELVGSLCLSAEELLISSGDKRLVVKRLFSILIEGLQNVRLHGQRDEYERQLGYLILGRQDDQYIVIMANMIHPDDQEKVESYLDRINHYDADKLKEAYLTVLNNEFVSDKGGAGLGFITTRMKSEHPLRYSFYQLKSEALLFTFEVVLDRDQKN
jgi:hypothetical protein